MCVSTGGGHHRKLLKHCVIATKSQSFVLQEMKCGLLDSDNPANGPWRKVVQPPLWACHLLTHSFTHSLPHLLISHALQPPRLQNSNTAPFWLLTAHLNSHFPLETQTSRFPDARLVPFLYEPPLGGLFPSGPYGEMAAAAVWEGLPQLYLRLSDCQSGLVSQTRPFHKCWRVTVK